ncbi:NUDIX hydrolase [Entomobacter blattae]|uniref:Nudix hydrolase domain-containing protein n=1 Tax=Entomobacter blattae TaxID=2762277 RepID=A0A7H1NSU4_9PROT|nr:NUDIX domain-containing protein [Entomobacter blattae]QNT78854.1 hypothetical protein JGUZn3_16330 [Entomobacter blattae]
MSINSSALFQHIQRCNLARIQGYRIPFFVSENTFPFGWVEPNLIDELKNYGVRYYNNALYTDHTETEFLTGLGEFLAHRGQYKPHHELFDVYSDITLPPISTIDRGALPLLGIIGMGVHMNGLTRKQGKTYLWVAKRSADKRLDPSKLDHIVAGGIPAGLNAYFTLIKEADEEASIPPSIMQTATYARKISYTIDRPEGLRRDILFCYDLNLPEDFTPTPKDGEVESFSLIPLEEVAEIVCTTQRFKFNVNLVLIDLFIRHGLIEPTTPEAIKLSEMLDPLCNSQPDLIKKHPLFAQL